MDLIYLIKHVREGNIGGEVIFTTSDANKAIGKSVELIKDQHGHEVEVWAEGKKVGTIDLVL
jgi:hypothetical protein